MSERIQTRSDQTADGPPRAAPDYDPKWLQQILKRAESVAVVGASSNPQRPSWIVSRYLRTRGYRVTPINPGAVGKSILDAPFVASLRDIPASADPVHMITIFRRSDAVGPIVEEALETLAARGLQTIWMQIGVINWEAAARAEAAGLNVVMNRCPKIELSRFNGELGWGGFNSGVISARLPTPPKPFGSG